MPSIKTLLKSFSLFCLLGVVAAHPGEDHSEEIAARNAAKHINRSLDHCNGKLMRRGHQERAVARREAKVKQLRKERGLPVDAPIKRAPIKRTVVNPAFNQSHHSDHAYNQLTPADVLFASNTSCMLTPWSTEGPFFVERTLIRQDLREQQEGVDMVVEFEWINYNTCEPIPNLFVDFWHANSTGVYSGIAHGVFPNGDDDETNLQTTFFRGVQATDAYGLTEFTSKFPGNYDGRAVHIHLISNVNGTVLPNGTYSPGNYTHVSQLYFDQALIAEIYTVEPYASNTQALTLNTEDGIGNGETVGSDPVMEYVWLGDHVEDGIFAWKKLGVDVVPITNITIAATHYKEGDEMTVNDTYLKNYRPPLPPGVTALGPPPSATPVATGS